MIKKLDTLFDISSCCCQLPIVSCDDKYVKCQKENCQAKHIVCKCPLKQKVPLEDREYLKDQRNKIGPKGSFQLGPIHKASFKKQKRSTVLRERGNQVDSSAIASTSCDQDVSLSQSENSDETFEPDRRCMSDYSQLKITRYAIELIRGDVSSNLGASLANAFLLDLQAMGLLNQGVNINNIILDKSKIDRQKEKTKEHALQKHQEKNENLVCIGVDTRHDKDTLFYQEVVEANGETKVRKAKGPEHHITLTKEMGCDKNGGYLTHRVIPNTNATGVVLAKEVASVLEKCKSVDTLKAVLLDNTNTNTGCESGLVTSLEKIFKRKLHTIGCSLHRNELPFRALFKWIDGSTQSPTSFTGPIGKLCGDNYNHLPQVKFPSISSPLDDNYSTLVGIEDLSGDQRLLFEYAVGISRGKVDPRYAAWRIGPLNQARWLTLAIRLMCLWIRNIYPQTLFKKMKILIKFVVEVYAVSWFEIKRDNKFHNQQRYIFNMIQRIKQQPQEVQTIAFKNIQYNTFALLPENILFAMVKSDELEVREDAIKRILTIRSAKETKKRLKKISTINFKATHWSHLINLSQSGICEPAFREGFSDEELRESSLSGRKLNLPEFPAHSQTVERAVKLTTEASQLVYGFESRHKHIIAKVLCREMRPSFDSKGSYVGHYEMMQQ